MQAATESAKRLRLSEREPTRETFVERLLLHVDEALGSDAPSGGGKANQIRERVRAIADDTTKESERKVLEARFALGHDDAHYLTQAVSVLWAGDGGEQLRIVPHGAMPGLMRTASAEGIVRAMGDAVEHRRLASEAAIGAAADLASWLLGIEEIKAAVEARYPDTDAAFFHANPRMRRVAFRPATSEGADETTKREQNVIHIFKMIYYLTDSRYTPRRTVETMVRRMQADVYSYFQTRLDETDDDFLTPRSVADGVDPRQDRFLYRSFCLVRGLCAVGGMHGDGRNDNPYTFPSDQIGSMYNSMPYDAIGRAPLVDLEASYTKLLMDVDTPYDNLGGGEGDDARWAPLMTDEGLDDTPEALYVCEAEVYGDMVRNLTEDTNQDVKATAKICQLFSLASANTTREATPKYTVHFESPNPAQHGLKKAADQLTYVPRDLVPLDETQREGLAVDAIAARFAHAIDAAEQLKQVEHERAYIDKRLKTKKADDFGQVFTSTGMDIERAAREGRAGLWSDALREISVSGDRLYRFVMILTGSIGESADTALAWEDDALKEAAKDAATKQRALAERVSKFQTRLVESVVSSTLKGSKLQLDMRGKQGGALAGHPDQELMVLSSDLRDSIRQIADGEAGHGFFETSVQLNEALGRASKPMSMADIVGRLQAVGEAFHHQLASSMATTVGPSYARLVEPRNSFLLHLKPDVLAALHKALDHVKSEMAYTEGMFHRTREIRLWELVEGRDWTLVSRFAELVGLMLQHTRMRSGSFAAYVGTSQLIANAHNIRMQIQRVKEQACHYLCSGNPPGFLESGARSRYFGGSDSPVASPSKAKRQKLKDTSSALRGDEDDDDGYHAHITRRRAIVDALLHAAAEVEAERRKAEEAYVGAMVRVNVLQVELQETENALKAEEAAHAQTTDDLNNCKATTAALKVQYTLRRMQMTRLHEEALQTLETALKQSKDSAEAAVAAYTTRIQELEASIESEKRAAKVEKDALKQTNLALQGDIESKEEQLEAARRQLDTLKQVAQKSAERVEELQEEVQVQQRGLNAAGAFNSQLRKDLESSKKKLVEVQEESALNEADALRADLLAKGPRPHLLPEAVFKSADIEKLVSEREELASAYETLATDEMAVATQAIVDASETREAAQGEVGRLAAVGNPTLVELTERVEAQNALVSAERGYLEALQKATQAEDRVAEALDAISQKDEAIQAAVNAKWAAVEAAEAARVSELRKELSQKLKEVPTSTGSTKGQLAEQRGVLKAAEDAYSKAEADAEAEAARVAMKVAKRNEQSPDDSQLNTNPMGIFSAPKRLSVPQQALLYVREATATAGPGVSLAALRMAAPMSLEAAKARLQLGGLRLPVEMGQSLVVDDASPYELKVAAAGLPSGICHAVPIDGFNASTSDALDDALCLQKSGGWRHHNGTAFKAIQAADAVSSKDARIASHLSDVLEAGTGLPRGACLHAICAIVGEADLAVEAAAAQDRLQRELSCIPDAIASIDKEGVARATDALAAAVSIHDQLSGQSAATPVVIPETTLASLSLDFRGPSLAYHAASISAMAGTPVSRKRSNGLAPCAISVAQNEAIADAASGKRLARLGDLAKGWKGNAAWHRALTPLGAECGSGFSRLRQTPLGRDLLWQHSAGGSHCVLNFLRAAALRD